MLPSSDLFMVDSLPFQQDDAGIDDVTNNSRDVTGPIDINLLISDFFPLQKERGKLQLGASTIKPFTAVIVAVSLQARVFATSMYFHPGLTFAGKAAVYQSGAPYGTLVGLTLHSIFRLCWK